MISKGTKIAPANGKLGVVLPGMGAVSSTFIAGIEAIKKGFAKPIGSLTQMGTIRLGKRTENRVPSIKEFVPLTYWITWFLADGIFFRTTFIRPLSRQEYWKKACWTRSRSR